MSWNKLERFLLETSRKEGSAMDFLQDRGVISDECVDACDVASVDCNAAIDAILHESLFGDGTENG